MTGGRKISTRTTQAPGYYRRPVFSLTAGTVLHHQPREFHARHVHVDPFVAVVLDGIYEECGDTGRWQVAAGSAIAHTPFEGHFNQTSNRGARVLLLPTLGHELPALLQVTDPDAVARQAERCRRTALEALLDDAEPDAFPARDWPDELAHWLTCNLGGNLSWWARHKGLKSETVSRGFRRAFGCSPSEFRLRAMCRAALHAARSSDRSLTLIAHECHFADLAHMSRSIRAYSGTTPSQWRSNWIDQHTASPLARSIGQDG